MKKPTANATFTLRQLRFRGWRRVLFASMFGGVLVQLFILAILSTIGFGLYEMGNRPPPVWNRIADDSIWVYRQPLEPIVIPFDQYAKRRVFVGTRIDGMVYVQRTHGDEPNAVSIPGPPLLISSYAPPEGEQMYNFVEDRIGFPFRSARSLFIMESTDSPAYPSGVRWTVYRGIKIADEHGSSSVPLPREFVAIPLSPIVSGFLLNTLIYAVPLALFILFVRAVRLMRARSRVRRGMCPACAYALSEKARCPECGLDMNTPWEEAIRAGLKPRKLSQLQD